MKTYVAIVTDTFSNQCRDGSGLQCEFIHQNVSWLNSQSGRLSRRKLDHSWAHTQRWSRFHPPKKWTTGLQHTRGSTTAAVCHLRTPHAPRVYAFDKDKILMEKCAPLQEIHHKTFLDWLKTVFNFSNFEKRSFNSMPSRGHWPPADSWHELRPCMTTLDSSVLMCIVEISYNVPGVPLFRLILTKWNFKLPHSTRPFKSCTRASTPHVSSPMHPKTHRIIIGGRTASWTKKTRKAGQGRNGSMKLSLWNSCTATSKTKYTPSSRRHSRNGKYGCIRASKRPKAEVLFDKHDPHHKYNPMVSPSRSRRQSRYQLGRAG